MNLRRAGLVLATACAVAAAGAAPSWSASRALRPKARTGPSGVQRVTSLDNQRRIDINNLNMFVTNFGSFAFDLGTGNSGLYYPTGTANTAVFASGLWLGAQVGTDTRVTVAEYSQEYGPGVILSPGVWDNASLPQYKVYKVQRYSSPQDTAHVDRSAEDLAADPAADPLVHHSWSEYLAGAAPYGAPTRLWRLPDTSTPTEGDSVDVLGPDVLGDQMLWAVYNDADPTRHTNDAGNSAPLGVEVRQSTFGFDRPGPLGNTVFLKFVIINKGTDTLNNMYVSFWSDPDLGNAADDLVGSDTTLSVGYVYNANNNDTVYGSDPPVVGYDFFLGPVNALGDTLPLTSFNKYINGTDPAAPSESYNYMQGLLPDGSVLIDPTTGQPTTYFHPGDPVTGTGWLDTNPADRRFLLSSGPFTMAPGDTQVVVGAIVVGQGSDRLSSISGMRFYDSFAQDAFNRNFVLPSPPPQPQVDVTTTESSVTLCWDQASRTQYNQPGYTFEGYNVYQGETVAGPWRRIATYDEINSIRVVFDEVFDVTTGQLIPLFPVAFGSDAGIQYCTTITQDAIRGGTLKEGTEYYFAVTAYSVGLDERPKVLENAQAVIRVIPQSPASGTDVATAAADSFTYTRINTGLPPATDVVTATVVSPNVVRAACYKVVFLPLPDTAFVNGEPVTLGWNLINTTTGDTLLRNQVNKTGDADYAVVEGIQVRVVGAYSPQLQDVAYVNANTAHRRALGGVNFGLTYFGGGADYGWNFFGGTLDPAVTDSFTTVQIQFDTTRTQLAYRFLRLEKASDGSAPPQGRGYLYGGFHEVPFQVWDVINNVQLEAAFVERTVTDDAGTILPLAQQPATHDSTWNPDLIDNLGGREYLFVIKRPYTGTPDPTIATDGSVADDSQPLMYAMAAGYRAEGDVIDPGDYVEFTFANPATSNDVYTFCTSELRRGNAALAATGLNRIRAVPNPYYTHSRYELSQFNRVIRFINMPENATVRIFNLAGSLVRTLQKTNATTSVLDWDLETENQLPVASGVYIYHVDVPGAGSTFGRLVVFMEKERLNNY